MADKENAGDKVAKYTITNSSRGPRYVNTPEGGQAAIPPGGQWSGDLTANEAKSAKARPDLTVSGGGGGGKAAKAEPGAGEPGAGGAGGGAGAGDGGGNNQDPTLETDKQAAYVAHEGLGRWYAYNAADEKVATGDDAEPKAMAKSEAQTWAIENKVEFRGGKAE